jgi:hypothetical protein
MAEIIATRRKIGDRRVMYRHEVWVGGRTNEDGTFTPARKIGQRVSTGQYGFAILDNVRMVIDRYTNSPPTRRPMGKTIVGFTDI